jgi:Ca2+-binding EF-hand superfamily protein
MSNSKRFTIALVIAGLMGGSAAVANAQEAPAAPAVAAPAVVTTTTETPAAPTGPLAAIKAMFGRHDGKSGKRGGGAMFQELMTEVDTDKNGSVTQDEINAFRAAKVAAADTSKDGALSVEEFATAYNELMRTRMVDAFQSFDNDGDGSITAAELDTRFNTIVAQMDRNGDGTLSPADHMRGDGEGRGKDGKHGGKNGGKHGGRHGYNNDQNNGQNN